MAKYTATLYGSSISNHPGIECDTIREARDYAESYGNTADSCVIERNGREVARHMRDTSGNGLRWYRATPRA